jgi:5'-nucleotidase (lipoprotein e(P4) family)
MKKFCFLLFLIYTGIHSTSEAQDAIRIAAWNVEHLAEKNGEGCVARTDEDYAKLRAFAAGMDAHVVGLQEVESAKAVHRVFPESEWEVVLSDRPDSEPYECRGSGRPSTQQKVGLAIRKGVTYEKVDSFKELAIGNPGLRYGVIIRLTGGAEPIDVLSVHLKSGCFVDDYRSSDSDACETFEDQAPVLDAWIEEKITKEEAFVVLGDFNHRLTVRNNRFWAELNEINGEDIKLVSSMDGIRGCHPRYPDPIDHVVLGPNASKYILSGSQKVHYFGDSAESMTEDDMLSDHCPVSIQLSLIEPFPMSSAVKWTQKSAEYKIISSFLYRRGIEAIKQMVKTEPWVVFMDVDETLLDNSEYNRRRDQLRLGYTSESWAAWVMEEAATEIPGSKAFVEAVIEAGGQIAMITNRNRSLDLYTWSNLQALGYPLNRNNACIIGRAQEDRDAVGQDGIVNDKDLRRNNVRTGNAEACWENYPEAKSSWNRELNLLMQVGDNIQDFEKTTQENVDLEAFLNRQGVDILILPNAMYGSWD